MPRMEMKGYQLPRHLGHINKQRYECDKINNLRRANIGICIFPSDIGCMGGFARKYVGWVEAKKKVARSASHEDVLHSCACRMFRTTDKVIVRPVSFRAKSGIEEYSTSLMFNVNKFPKY